MPLAVDGMIMASSMSILLASRYGRRGGALAWILLIIGSLASLGANAAVADPTLIARVIAAWPSFALIGAYEMLVGQIRQGQWARGRSREGVRQDFQSQSVGGWDDVQPKAARERPGICIRWHGSGRRRTVVRMATCHRARRLRNFLAVPAGGDGSRSPVALDSLSHRRVTPSVEESHRFYGSSLSISGASSACFCRAVG
ncbi:DUF2637 domain-containing protein [Nonomuraea polychroma]|uniref:DUF2637 domain-containing protein n=1 Tax=Nonomuraea polychroma TaxID=46176 RepID=UPI0030C87335